MAGQINNLVAPVTAESHKFTHNFEFTGEEFPELITKAGFRNLLEAHIRSLNKAKQVSYTRNQEWLDAIRHGSDMPPSGYAGNRASWRNEIGATNPATSKWVVEGDRVYKRSANGKESGAMTPTEKIYELMTSVHMANGHKGRDNFYKLVQIYSGSIKKAFCGQFVQVCCEKGELWEAGGSVKYDFKPEVRRRAAQENKLAAAAPAAAAAKKIDDNLIVDNRIAVAANADLDKGFLEEMRRVEAYNFGQEVVDHPGPLDFLNEQNVALDPQLFEMANNYSQNNAGIFQEFPVAHEVQMDERQKLNFQQYGFDQNEFEQYAFEQYNLDEDDFFGQGVAIAQAQANANYPGQIQQNYFVPNNGMIAEQPDHNMFIDNMEIGLEYPVMYDNDVVDDNPAPWQEMPMPADPQAFQQAHYGPEMPSYDMDFDDMNADGAYAFNMKDVDDTEVSTS